MSAKETGKGVHSALPARLWTDDTSDDTSDLHLMDCEGDNPVSAQGVGGSVPLVTVDFG